MARKRKTQETATSENENLELKGSSETTNAESSQSNEDPGSSEALNVESANAESSQGNEDGDEALDDGSGTVPENDLDAFIEDNDKSVMPKVTLPTEAELSPALKIVSEYLNTVSSAIPATVELIRLNSRLRDAVYLILNQENTEFAIQQLRQLVHMAVEKQTYVFDTSMTFQGLEKLRWPTGMRREYESILTTISKMRKWVKEEEVGTHAWERLRADIRPVKSEQYARVILGAVGIES